MANEIDNKVVQFELDNRNFEKNADKSLKTIDKLQTSLNFDKATKSLNNMSASASSINFNALADSVEAVKVKFSAWDTIAMGVLHRISDKVVDLTTNFVKSVSGISMMTTGFSKYEEKTTAVQTIMSATANTWKKNAEAIGFEGTQMEFVNEQLEKLNWFSDETSFSFTDMTSNIGKFTSSGVDLDKAVTAMEGISVWAAKSGQNAQSASRAYYNLAQAISVGSVKLIDWKSIENANMATMEFKQTAIDTAVELKYLKKAGDGLYKTTSGNLVSVENFNEALKDEWFSSEVLMKSLEKYGKAATRLSEISEDYNVTATSFLYNMDKWTKGEKDITSIARSLGISVEELQPLFEELNSEEYKLGLSAFKAAQEAKTFHEAIEATKDAVSTGWMKTFEIIFGNYEEAKVLWTEMANRLWDVFAAGGETRNEVLALWKEAGGQKALVDAFWDLWDAVSEFADIVKEAFGEIFNVDIWVAAGKLDAFTTKFKNFVKSLHMSEETADKFKRTFKGLFAAVDILKDALSVITIPLKTLLNLLFKGSGTVLDFSASIGDWLVEIRDFVKETKIFEKVGEGISNLILGVVYEVGRFKDMIIGSFKATNTGLANAITLITNIITFFIEAFADGFMALTGLDISDFINSLTNGIRKFAQYFIDFANTLDLNPIIEKFKKFLSDLKDNFKQYAKIDTSGLTSLVSKIHISFEPITGFLDGIRKIFNGFLTFLSRLAPFFIEVAKLVGKALGAVGESISNFLFSSDFEGMDKLVKTGIFAAIGTAIFNFISKLKDAVTAGGGVFTVFAALISRFTMSITAIAGNANGILAGIKGVLDGTKGALEAWQKDIKSNILLKIAAAIGIISISLIMLSKVDSDKLMKAMSVITAEFIELVGSMRLLSTIEFKKLAVVGGTLIKLSVAILILSLACRMLAGLDFKDIVQGVAAIAALSFILVKVAASLSKNVKHMVKGAGSMIIFALAIRLLVKPVKELGAMDLGNLLKGLLGVLVLLEGISLFLSKKMKGSVKAGLAMIAMAAATLIMAKAVKSFAEINYEEMLRGLSALALVLFGMSKFMQAISGTKKMISAGIGMVVMAASMLIFAKAIEQIGNLKIDVIGKGLLGMAGALLAITLAMNFMPKGMISKGLGLVLVASALNILASAFSSFGNMKWEEIGKAMVALAGGLAIIVVALNLMKGTIGASLAMMIFAAALAVLTPCIKILGSMKWENIAKAGVILAGMFTILGAAGYLLGPAVPVILALSAAVLILGTGTLLCAAGLLALSAALVTLGGAGVVGINSIILMVKGLIELIPDLGTMVAQAMVNTIVIFAESAGDLAKALGKLIIALVETVLDTLDKLTPKIVRFLTNTLVELVNAGLIMLKSLIPKLFDFLVYLVQQLAIFIGPLIEGLIDTILNIIMGIANKLPAIIDTAVKFIIQLINGLAQAIDDNAEIFRDAFYNLFASAFEAVLLLFGFDRDEAKKMVETAGNLIKSFIKGIVKMATDLLEGFVELFAVIIEFFDAMFTKFKNFGINLIQGLIDGITGMADKAIETVTGLGNAIADKFKKTLKIKSPSRLFKQFGEYIDMGLISGISSMTSDVEKATGLLGTAITDDIQGPLNELSKSFEDTSYAAKIVPVVDSKTFDTGLKNMKNVISDSTLHMSNSNQRTINENLSAQFSKAGLDTLDTDIVKAIQDLQSETQMLGTYISGMSLTLDGKTLVGGIAPMMNVKLGQYARYNGRGN